MTFLELPVSWGESIESHESRTPEQQSISGRISLCRNRSFREGKFIYVVKKMFVFQSLNFRKNFLWILWEEEFLTSLVKLWQEWRWAAAQIVWLFSLSIPAAIAAKNRSTFSSVCVWCRRGAATVVKVFESFYFYAPIFQVREKLIATSWKRDSLWNCSPVILFWL